MQKVERSFHANQVPRRSRCRQGSLPAPILVRYCETLGNLRLLYSCSSVWLAVLLVGLEAVAEGRGGFDTVGIPQRSQEIA
jgi:hypothetical protein